ncbi:hypothetical protein CL654_03050 [bacterium]|nr:hypothetical protein [bacterium]
MRNMLVVAMAFMVVASTHSAIAEEEGYKEPFFRTFVSAEHPHIFENGLAINGGIQGRVAFDLVFWEHLYANIEVRTRWDEDFSERGPDKWITWEVGTRFNFAGIETECGASYFDSDDFFARSTDDTDTRQISLSDIGRAHCELAHTWRLAERHTIRPFINVGAYIPIRSGLDHGFITNLAVDYGLSFRHLDFEARIGAMNDTGAFGFGSGWLARARAGAFVKLWRVSVGPVVEVIHPLSINDITTEVPVPSDLKGLVERFGVSVPKTVNVTTIDPRNDQGTTYAVKAEFRFFWD